MQGTDYEQFHENKIHGAAAFPYITYPCTIPLDFPSVPPHWHEDMELIVITQGRGVISVNLENYLVDKGCVLLITPGSLHAIDRIPGEEMQYENIIFSLNMLSSDPEDWCSQCCFFPLRTGNVTLPVLLRPSDRLYSSIRECISNADAVCEQHEDGYQLEVKAQMFRLFFILYRGGALQKSTCKNNRNLEKIKQALRYVEEHYAGVVTVEQAAKLCCFSSSYFMKFFREAMGETFVEYLVNYRLSAAARALIESDNPVIIIAQNAGFDNISYFNRRFKQKYGMTPGSFRKARR